MDTMTRKQMADALRVMADRIEEVDQQLSLPESEYTLPEAHAKLKEVLGTGYWSLDLTIVESCGTDVTWDIWDGKAHHKSSSLHGAVNACLAAHQSPPADPLVDAERLLATT